MAQAAFGDGHPQNVMVQATFGDAHFHKLSNPEPGHTTGQSGRGGARRGGEGGSGLGRTGRRRVDPARRRPSLLPSIESKTLSWTTLRKHEQRKSHVNRMREQSHRLTTSLSAVDPRLISRTASALRSWLLTRVPTPICLCKPFSHARHVRRYYVYLSNPKPGHTTNESGRSARRSGRAESRKIRCQQNYRLGNKIPSSPSRHRRNVASNVSPEARTSEILCNLLIPKPAHITGGSVRSARRSGKIGCQQNYSLWKQKSSFPSKASKKRRFNVSPEARTIENSI